MAQNNEMSGNEIRGQIKENATALFPEAVDALRDNRPNAAATDTFVVVVVHPYKTRYVALVIHRCAMGLKKVTKSVAGPTMMDALLNLLSQTGNDVLDLNLDENHSCEGKVKTEEGVEAVG
ncbi:hypothetical protein LTR10_007312 [Elasticomyces elasticus]|nr:hypothetical protein LTR10_007312 [Elasticomyces elasticus]KAK4979124.1 hypothetical protein LTR42_001626 [Elasticomyces elasticus]